jgi:hypothetical protein
MHWIRAHVCLILIYGTFMIAGSSWLAQRIRFHGVQDWPSVNAENVRSGMNTYPMRSEYWDGSRTRWIESSYVLFEHSVDGQFYESDLATPDGGGLPLNPIFTSVDQAGRRTTTQEQWKAFYNPASPSTAVLLPTPYEGMPWLYTTLVCGLLIAIHLACVLPEKLEWLRWKRIAAKNRAEQAGTSNGG